MWLRNNRLPALASLAFALVVAAIALVFFYAPVDQDGLNQKIFYFHVAIALTAYACFAWGGWKALRVLWKRDERADLESYVAIHQGVIFGALTLITGSIWARYRWGHWWEWHEDQLVLFLVLFLFYAAYFMLRFSVPAGPRRANLSAVYALFGVALVPVSILAIRLVAAVHPSGRLRSARSANGRLAVLHVLRLVGRAARARGDALPRGARGQAHRRAAAGATRGIAMTSEEKYVAAAYLVIFAFVLAYVVIIALKLQRLERELAELAELAKERQEEREVAHVG